MTEQPGRLPRWAPRVPKDKIKRLYEREARGILDEALIEDVGLMLFLRCRDILRVDDASHGRVHCPACDQIMPLPAEAADTLLLCPACGWQATWGRYSKTYRGKQLSSGGALPAFQLYVRLYENTNSVRERLLLIDRLIHAFHISLFKWADGPQATRSVCPNLIDGKLSEMIPFLAALAGGAASLPERHDTHAAWLQALKSMEDFFQNIHTLRDQQRREEHDGD